MIIVMASRKREDIDRVIEKIQEFGYQAHLIEGVERTVIGAVGDERGKDRLQSLESLPGVESVVRILKPFKLAGRELRKDDSVYEVGTAQSAGRGSASWRAPVRSSPANRSWKTPVS